MYILFFISLYIYIYYRRFYKLRYSYIIHKRGFNLTFSGGIMAFLDIILSFVSLIIFNDIYINI